MNKRVPIIGPVLICFVLTLLGCQSDHVFDRYHHVGDIYQVSGNVYILGERLKDDWDAKAMERPGGVNFQKFEKIPLGTKIRIVSIEKVTAGSTFREGRYSYFIVMVEILAPGYEGRRYDARGMVAGEHDKEFGVHRSNIISLKPVSQANEK